MSLAGALAAVRAAGLGLLTVMVLVLVAWATAQDSGASASEAVGTGLAIWLVGQLAQVDAPGGTFGLAPLGLTLLPAGLLFSAAAGAARSAGVRGRRGVAALTAALAASYAALVVVGALVAPGGAVRPDPVTAFLGAAGLAVVAGGAGAVRGSGRAGAWWARLPVTARLAARGGAGAVACLLGCGALLVASMLARHLTTAADLLAGLDAGVSGSLLVLLVCLVYAPTAAVWGAAYLVGPGFTVGIGTSVAVTGVTPGAVPALPLFAALPASAGDPRLGWLALGASTLLAGLLAGLLVDRAARREPAALSSWRELLLVAGTTGAVAGTVLAALALVSSGPAGPGRFADTGPSAWQVGLATAAEVAVVVAAVLAVARRGLFRRTTPAGQRADRAP